MNDTSPLSRRAVLALLTTSAAGFVSASAADADETAARVRQITDGFHLLDRIYWSPQMRIWLDRPGNDLRACYEGRLNPPWWSCANAVETLADFMRLTKSNTWEKPLAELHARHVENPDQCENLIAALKDRGQWSAEDARKRTEGPRPRHSTKAGYRDFNNEYLDDSGWWGLAWLKMHSLTKDARYLATAQAIHAHMHAHRGADGGILWNLEHEKPVENAISNGLFLTLSARLALVSKDAACLAQAHDAREWFLKNKLFDGTGIVDAPGHEGDYWSYNQGMWILGLLALSEAADEPALTDEAATFARTVLEKGGFVVAGILTEKLSQSGWDTALFKGVLARATGELSRTLRKTARLPGTADFLDEILEKSASAILENSRGKDGQFGFQWGRMPEKQDWNFNTHLAGLMALTAALPAA